MYITMLTMYIEHIEIVYVWFYENITKEQKR